MPFTEPAMIHGVETGIEYVVSVRIEKLTEGGPGFIDFPVVIRSGDVMTRAELREYARTRAGEFFGRIADTRPASKEEYGQIVSDTLVSSAFYP